MNFSYDPLILEMDQAMIKQEAAQRKRGYLGMSGIGHDCLRKSWLDFRWCASPEGFSALTLRNFADGHYSEDLTAKRLQAIPHLQLFTHDRDGGQYGFTDIGGHFRGHIDGQIKMKHETQWRIWEHKCVNEKKFHSLNTFISACGESFALEQWDFVYYAQAQLYLHYANAEEHYLTVATSGSRKYTSCRTGYDQTTAERMILRAESVIKAPRMLPAISEDETFYLCAWCNHKNICHGESCGEVSCRTCIHSEAVIDDGDFGFWYCHKHGEELDRQAQEMACCEHRLLPELLDRFAENIDADDDTVFYRHRSTGVEFSNGAPGIKSYSSDELCDLENKSLIGDEFADDLRTKFDARFGK